MTVGDQPDARTQAARILARVEAAVALVYPEDMTPSGRRVFESIIEEERDGRADAFPSPREEALEAALGELRVEAESVDATRRHQIRMLAKKVNVAADALRDLVEALENEDSAVSFPDALEAARALLVSSPQESPR